MTQKLIPIEGALREVNLQPTVPEGSFLSEPYTIVKNLQPRPTEWSEGGKPIYDRLPAASQRYNLNFTLDDNTAYPYIPYGEGYTGPTSMAVQTSGENKFLVIQAGKIVWKFGTLETDPVIIDLEKVGFGSAQYLLAYQLYYDDAPIPSKYEVSDFSLSGLTLDIRSNTDSVSGWRYTPDKAFTDSDDFFWSNYDNFFPNYYEEAELSWQTPLPCAFSKITLRFPYGHSPAGEATLSVMACSEEDYEFCSNPNWEYMQSIDYQVDADGVFYEFIVEDPIFNRGWKVEWEHNKVAVQSVSVSGVVTLMKRPATASTNYSLVAYPTNSIPESFTNSQGEKVPLVLCKLAYVDIDNNYTVKQIRDIREVVYSDFKPIAEWLTRPWDDNLKRLFREFSSYAIDWMSPTEAMKREYSKLTNSGINLTQRS